MVFFPPKPRLEIALIRVTKIIEQVKERNIVNPKNYEGKSSECFLN